MLKQVTTTEATILLITGAIVGGVLVATQAPVWTAYVAVALAGIVWGVLLARRWRGGEQAREPKPDAPRPEPTAHVPARVGGHR
jgi:uncharacterized membrane protein YfcA